VTEPEHAAENRRQQIELYGEPLADILRFIGSTLGLSQAEIASLLGLSAPMLSHLISGRRVKIGNPVAGARLMQLRALSGEVASGEAAPGDVSTRLQVIGGSGVALGGETATVRTQSLHASSARDVQQLFRAVAGALEWIEVADLAAEHHPEIAELLRVYGAGRSDAADGHWARFVGSQP
jgi:DNA-binding transcriptional regulator YdaS (Cro superfamily)